MFLVAISLQDVSFSYQECGIFCGSRKFSHRSITSCRAENAAFRDVIGRLEQRRECQGLPIQSFLTLPMQRITRLPLLVDAVCHRLDPEAPEYQGVTRTLHNLQKVNRRVPKRNTKNRSTRGTRPQKNAPQLQKTKRRQSPQAILSKGDQNLQGARPDQNTTLLITRRSS